MNIKINKKFFKAILASTFLGGSLVGAAGVASCGAVTPSGTFENLKNSYSFYLGMDNDIDASLVVNNVTSDLLVKLLLEDDSEFSDIKISLQEKPSAKNAYKLIVRSDKLFTNKQLKIAIYLKDAIWIKSDLIAFSFSTGPTATFQNLAKTYSGMTGIAISTTASISVADGTELITAKILTLDDVIYEGIEVRLTKKSNAGEYTIAFYSLNPISDQQFKIGAYHGGKFMKESAEFSLTIAKTPTAEFKNIGTSYDIKTNEEFITGATVKISNATSTITTKVFNADTDQEFTTASVRLEETLPGSSEYKIYLTTTSAFASTALKIAVYQGSFKINTSPKFNIISISPIKPQATIKFLVDKFKAFSETRVAEVTVTDVDDPTELTIEYTGDSKSKAVLTLEIIEGKIYVIAITELFSVNAFPDGITFLTQIHTMYHEQEIGIATTSFTITPYDEVEYKVPDDRWFDANANIPDFFTLTPKSGEFNVTNITAESIRDGGGADTCFLTRTTETPTKNVWSMLTPSSGPGSTVETYIYIVATATYVSLIDKTSRAVEIMRTGTMLVGSTGETYFISIKFPSYEPTENKVLSIECNKESTTSKVEFLGLSQYKQYKAKIYTKSGSGDKDVDPSIYTLRYELTEMKDAMSVFITSNETIGRRISDCYFMLLDENGNEVGRFEEARYSFVLNFYTIPTTTTIKNSLVWTTEKQFATLSNISVDAAYGDFASASVIVYDELTKAVATDMICKYTKTSASAGTISLQSAKELLANNSYSFYLQFAWTSFFPDNKITVAAIENITFTYN